MKYYMNISFVSVRIQPSTWTSLICTWSYFSCLRISRYPILILKPGKYPVGSYRAYHRGTYGSQTLLLIHIFFNSLFSENSNGGHKNVNERSLLRHNRMPPELFSTPISSFMQLGTELSSCAMERLLSFRIIYADGDYALSLCQSRIINCILKAFL